MTSFLGFELDLLLHELLVRFVCWISNLRNPGTHSIARSTFHTLISVVFFHVVSYPETLDIAPDTPDTKPGVSGLIPGVSGLSLHLTGF